MWFLGLDRDTTQLERSYVQTGSLVGMYTAMGNPMANKHICLARNRPQISFRPDWKGGSCMP